MKCLQSFTPYQKEISWTAVTHYFIHLGGLNSLQFSLSLYRVFGNNFKGTAIIYFLVCFGLLAYQPL